jgi:polyisoprenoid-binding protein YceI
MPDLNRKGRILLRHEAWNRAAVPALLAALAAALTACTGTSAPPALLPVAAEAEPPAAAPRGATDYRIDSAHSQLRILVHRGGPLAAVGHNHVITDEALSGWLRAAAEPRGGALYLQFSPEDFVIDPPAARAEEGADYAEPVDDDARAGTRRNLLRPTQLNVAEFPWVRVRGDAAERDAHGGWLAQLRVTIAGHTRLLDLPFTVARDGDALLIRADFRVTQTSLGLTPLAVLAGQLRVEDELQVKLQLRATPLQPGVAE